MKCQKLKIFEHVRKLRFQTKRGQITIFIIIGLILLLALAYFIFIREESLFEVEKIQPELIPVKNYVETCMHTIGKEALETLGLNGGYIYFPPHIENNPETYLSTSPTPIFKNPYWWYEGISSIPTPDFMEDQLTQYLNNNLPSCLSSFEAFGNVYDIVEHSDISTLTEIGDSMDSFVRVETRYEIEIKDKFNKTLAELKRFRTEIPVRLYAAHTLAKRIMEAENAQGFVERKVIDLMAIDEDIPDTGGPNFQCSKLKWEIPKINSKLRMIMAENFPFIKIKGTEFSEDRYLPLPEADLLTGRPLQKTFNESYYWSHYIWDVGDEDWSNMHVSFTYDYNWPLYWINDLYIRPNKYPMLFSNSEKSTNILSFFCMHMWHFTYDMTFPVKVTIVDEETPKNNEYSFIFAFKGSIDHNEPRRERFTSTDFEVEALVEDEVFCNDLYNDAVIFAMEDTTTGWEINNVNLTLVCGKFKCDLGVTKQDPELGLTPYWQGMTPYCTRGILRATKQGYADAETWIQTDSPDTTHYINMVPVKELKNFTVVKHQIEINEIATTVFPGQELAEDESALVMLKAKKKDFEETKVYPFEEETSEGERENLRLLAKDDYEYDVEIYLMDEESVIGGYKGTWKPYQEDVDKAKKAIFHVVYKEFTDDTEMALFFAGLESYSVNVKKPQLIK